MFPVFLLCVVFNLVFCENVTVSVLKGETLKLEGKQKIYDTKGCWRTFDGQHKCPFYTVSHYKGYEAKNFFWYHRPVGQEHFSLVGYKVNGTQNCSVSPVFGSRLGSCGDKFVLKDVRQEDSGTFKSRIKLGKRNSKVLLYKVEVEVLSPTIVPVALSKYNLLLKCCDRNSKARTFWLYNHPYGTATRRILLSGNSLHFTQMDAYFPLTENVQCCSRWGERDVCSASTPVVVDGSLCTESAPGRNWCQHRGKKFSSVELTADDSWKKMGRCSGREGCKIRSADSGNSTLCQGRIGALQGPFFTEEVVWRKKREHSLQEKYWTIGRNGTCFLPRFSGCASDLRFNPNLTDWGTYRQRQNGTITEFNVSVIGSPGVMLRLDHLGYATVVLSCVHGGYEEMEIKWNVDGSYEKVAVSGEKGEVLTLQADCWHSSKYWHADVRVSCEAVGKSWQGSSSAFYIKSFKDGCAWKRRAGLHILMDQS